MKKKEIGGVSVKGHEENNLQKVTPCRILFYYECMDSIMSVCSRQISTCGDKITALQLSRRHRFIFFTLFCFKYPTLSAQQLNKTVYWNTVKH